MKISHNEHEHSKNKSIQNGSSVESSNHATLTPPPYNVTASPIIQRKEHGTDGGKWEEDHKHGGKKRVPIDAEKPKQKWIRDGENGGWTQVDKGPQEKAPIAPIQLPEKYKDEEKKEGWRKPGKHTDKTKTVTKYFNAAEQEANSLDIEDGNLLNNDGYLSDFEHKKLYAMGKDGQIGAHNEAWLDANPDLEGNERQAVHHSSIFAGDDVMHAGHISTKEGKVTHLDDDSGHYRPDEQHTYAAYKKMKKQGILDENGNISLVDKTVANKGTAEWLQNQVNLPFAAYDQTKGNEKQIRNKMSVLEELMAKHSVNSPDDENFIPVPFSDEVQIGGPDPTFGTADLRSHEDDYDESYESEDSSDDSNMMFYNPLTGGFESRGSEGSNQGSQYPNHEGFYPEQESQYPNQVSPYLQAADTPYPNQGAFYQDQKSPYLQAEDSEEGSFFDLAGGESEEEY